MRRNHRLPRPIDPPASRTTDPSTSHIAEAQMSASGSISAQRADVLWAVCLSPDCTAREIARACRVDRYATSRRLPELERHGLVTRGPTRVCRVGGRLSATWRATDAALIEVWRAGQ